MNNKTYDAVVVGSGAAGSFAVKELTERGLEVLLLEAGRNITEDDFKQQSKPKAKGIGVVPRVKAALKGQPIQARVAFFDEQFSPFFVNDWQNPYTTPPGEFYLWIRGRQLGGRLHTFGRMLLRMTDYDFKAAGRDGVGEDWPITHNDLAPYYAQVEQFMGVYGDQDGVKNLPGGPYPGKPKLTSAEKQFKATVEARWPDRRVISWRYAGPNLKRVPRPILAAKATGRLTIRTDAVVSRLTADESTGKVIGAEFIDRLTKKKETVSARIFVVCASTVESVRLMLNSACAKHPNGLGNSSGMLGRYFIDQTSTLTFGSIPQFQGFELDNSAPPDPFYAPSGGIYIPRFQNLDTTTHPAFKRGFAFQGAMGRHFVPEEAPTGFGIMSFGEMLPSFENCVTINPRRKDAWGIPIPHIRCAIGGNERTMIREQLRTVREIMDSVGARIDFSGSPFGLEDEKNALPEANWLSRYVFRKSFKKSLSVGAAIHECGGARMGSDPAKSVLNSFNQCWDVGNLFVTDGSSFPSSGTVGPALTIMTLTARACEHIAKEYKDGRL